MEIDDGDGGDFKALYGTISDTLATTFTFRPTQRGRLYRARYRVRNAIGWSGYSPISYLRAAMRPRAPSAPKFVAATANTITITLAPSQDDGGAVITAYELWVDEGDLNSQFTKVTSYTGLETTFILDAAVETSLTPGVY